MARNLIWFSLIAATTPFVGCSLSTSNGSSQSKVLPPEGENIAIPAGSVGIFLPLVTTRFSASVLDKDRLLTAWHCASGSPDSITELTSTSNVELVVQGTKGTLSFQLDRAYMPANENTHIAILKVKTEGTGKNLLDISDPATLAEEGPTPYEPVTVTGVASDNEAFPTWNPDDAEGSLQAINQSNHLKPKAMRSYHISSRLVAQRMQNDFLRPYGVSVHSRAYVALAGWFLGEEQNKFLRCGADEVQDIPLGITLSGDSGGSYRNEAGEIYAVHVGASSRAFLRSPEQAEKEGNTLAIANGMPVSKDWLASDAILNDSFTELDNILFLEYLSPGYCPGDIIFSTP